MGWVPDFAETAELLRGVPGGRELLDWLDGEPNFGDAEVVSLHLNRIVPSTLTIETRGRRPTTVTFLFEEWVDVSVQGFNRQNVIGGLKLKRSIPRDAAPWEVGVGRIPGDVDIELEHCFGANGSIQARIERVEFEPRRLGGEKVMQPSSEPRP